MRVEAEALATQGGDRGEGVTPLVLLVTALAVYRLTLLVTADAITGPLRGRLPEGRLAELLGCPWCSSVWLAPPVVASGLWWSTGWGWWLVMGSLAASAVAGFLASYASP